MTPEQNNRNKKARAAARYYCVTRTYSPSFKNPGMQNVTCSIYAGDDINTVTACSQTEPKIKVSYQITDSEWRRRMELNNSDPIRRRGKDMWYSSVIFSYPVIPDKS